MSTPPNTRLPGRPPGTRPDPTPRLAHDVPGLISPERLLAKLARDLEPRALRAAAALIAEMDTEARALELEQARVSTDRPADNHRLSPIHRSVDQTHRHNPDSPETAARRASEASPS
jgi:hypothetical protein